MYFTNLEPHIISHRYFRINYFGMSKNYGKRAHGERGPGKGEQSGWDEEKRQQLFEKRNEGVCEEIKAKRKKKNEKARDKREEAIANKVELSELRGRLFGFGGVAAKKSFKNIGRDTKRNLKSLIKEKIHVLLEDALPFDTPDTRAQVLVREVLYPKKSGQLIAAGGPTICPATADVIRAALEEKNKSLVILHLSPYVKEGMTRVLINLELD